MASLQELHGRRGRTITDQNAQEITRVEELAYDLKVQDVMSAELHTVTPKMTMADLLELLRQAQISGTPVVDNGKLVGIVSLEDLIRSMCANDLEAVIEKYMTHEVIAARSYDPIVEAIELFTTHHVGRLPVVDEQGDLVGIITKGDITRGVLVALQNDYQEEEVRRYRPAISLKISFQTEPALSSDTGLLHATLSTGAMPLAISNALCCVWVPTPRSQGVVVSPFTRLR
jgi:CBS domain-containing protein